MNKDKSKQIKNNGLKVLCFAMLYIISVFGYGLYYNSEMYAWEWFLGLIMGCCLNGFIFGYLLSNYQRNLGKGK